MILSHGLAATLMTLLLGAAAYGGDSRDGPVGRLSLEVRVVGIDGKPIEKCTIGLWRLVHETERARVEAGPRGGLLWREADTGRVWEPIGGVAAGDRWRCDDLTPCTYRAAASFDHQNPTPMGTSEPVVLNAKGGPTIVTVKLRAGPTATFRMVDAATHRPVPGARLTLRREDTTLPPSWDWAPRTADDRGEITIRHLPPGPYSLTATRPATRPEEREYVGAGKAVAAVFAEGVDRVVEVPLTGRPLKPDEIEARWGWVATGKVVDEFGRPIAGAEVRAATGWGTLMGGGSTRTGPDGQFTVRFAEGWMSPDPVNAQAAVFSAAKSGLIETSRSKPGRLMMARKKPDDRARLGVAPDRIILKGEPYSIDFVLAEAAAVEVEAEGIAGSGADAAAPTAPSPALDIVGAEESGPKISPGYDGPNRWSLLPGRPWRFTLNDPARGVSVRSFPFTLPRGGRYRIAVRYTPDVGRGVPLLEIRSVTGPVGRREIRDKVVGDDPMARPPVSDDLQRRGREVLRRMAEANRPWLGPTPTSVTSYEYRFRFGEQEGRTIRVGEGTPAGDIRRGISHGSPVRHLAAHPGDATFRQVEIGDDRITLAYTLRGPIGVWAGNGVEGSWRGFFSLGVRDGILVLDARRFAPIESRSEFVREAFSQYVEVGPGRFAPMAVRVEKRGDAGMDFRWTFQVVQPGLWLFASSEDETGRVVARVDRIRVNGADARPIARGEGRVGESE